MLQYIKKRGSALTLLCALIVFLLPYQSLAQEMNEAMAQARMDAQRDADGKLWLISSCLLGVTTLIGAIALLLLASSARPFTTYEQAHG